MNTAVWLREVGERLNRTVTLAEVPAAEWDRIVPVGIDMVWLLGIWHRSKAGRQLALSDVSKTEEMTRSLPGWSESDVIGSPFSIYEYQPDPRLGDWDALAEARRQLAARGARLMLDWVPNHMGPDSPWLVDRPEAFMPASQVDLVNEPNSFIQVSDHFFALGRDPYFPPWPDVVQVNPFSPALRELAAAAISKVASCCDAVRADMAMLMLDDVVLQVWGARPGPPPSKSYWLDVMGAALATNPDFRFVAEVYWGREPDLRAMGFHYCYEKQFLDHIVAGDCGALSWAICAPGAEQAGLVRFLENHDEARAAASLRPWDRQRAATVMLATLPGMTLWHEGQADGRQVWLPVFLDRRLPEAPDDVRAAWHARLWRLAAVIRRGSWSIASWPGSPPAGLFAWTWVSNVSTNSQPATTVVFVNLSPQPVSGRLTRPAGSGSSRWQDCLSDRAGWSACADFLHVELGPWGYLILASEACQMEEQLRQPL